MKKVLGVLLILTIAVAALWAWLRYSPQDRVAQEVADLGGPTVVATVPHVASWLANLTESTNINVELLVTGQIDVHDFSFSTSDISLVNAAKVVIANGAGLEPWLNELSDLAPDAAVISTAPTNEIIDDDPHTWLDPVIAQAQVKNASIELQKVFPNQSTKIELNTEVFLTELRKLDSDIRSRLTRQSTKKFIAFHNAFSYFSARYDLDQIATVVERPGDQSTLKEIYEIDTIISDNNLSTLFIEPGEIPDLAKTIADEFELKLIVLDPLETISPEADAYINGMRDNIEALTVEI